MNGTEPDTVVTPPKKKRISGVLLLLGVFIAGMLCGGGLSVLHVMHRIREGMRNPGQRTEQAMNRLAHTLELTPEQQTRIRTILQAQNKDLQALREETWPRLVARLERTEKEIGAVLNPEQLRLWCTISADMRRYCLPPAPGGRCGSPDGRRPGKVRGECPEMKQPGLMPPPTGSPADMMPPPDGRQPYKNRGGIHEQDQHAPLPPPRDESQPEP